MDPKMLTEKIREAVSALYEHQKKVSVQDPDRHFMLEVRFHNLDLNARAYLR